MAYSISSISGVGKGSQGVWTKAVSSIAGSEQRVGNSMPSDSSSMPFNSSYKSQNANGNRSFHDKADSISKSSLPKEYQDAITWKKNSVNDTTFLNLASKVVKDGLAGVKQLLQ